MKCTCNRSTFCIIIASLYIFVATIVALISTISIFSSTHTDDDNIKRIDNIESLKIFCVSVAAIVLSSLYIVGIVKRRHYLLLPWLLIVVIVLCQTCAFIVIAFIGSAMGGASYDTFVFIMLTGLLAIVAQIAIFCITLSLFREIRKENNDKFDNVVISYQTDNTDYTVIPNKAEI